MRLFTNLAATYILPLIRVRWKDPAYCKVFRWCSKRDAISISVKAASAPLLPDLPPARFMACSMSSHVKTPNMQGTPELRPAESTPDAAELATAS
nr:hypothetical protein Iba_chr14cCG8520 [Ipomoea batatas]